ncbi:MAG: M20 family metallo-hydrolase [Leadbetterella sp.]|nr:M20 family metallo-hydrolase [Leadbetterella sp.]
MIKDFSPVDFLKELIKIPSLSREENGTRQRFAALFAGYSIPFEVLENNIWCKNRHYAPHKPVILLNSHHDTVKPNASYTRDPFKAEIEDGRLYGLGSNDAGGPLVALLATFLHFYDRPDLPWNLIFAATAEEEISGRNGIELLLKHLPGIDLAIVGEPTLMDMAVAEKGLMVLDCTARGVAGHAAREEGINAIYEALKDIEWFRTFEFPKVSETLGKVKMAVTVIQSGSQHNVVPDTCQYVVDVRATDAYTLTETLEIIRQHVKSEVVPRSVRLNPSGISPDHPIVKKGISLGMRPYGSPTLSDQALIPYPSIKIGPGDSARSHTADEFIYVAELEEGIEKYIALLEGLPISSSPSCS